MFLRQLTKFGEERTESILLPAMEVKTFRDHDNKLYALSLKRRSPSTEEFVADLLGAVRYQMQALSVPVLLSQTE